MPIYLLISAVICLNEGKDGYLYKASDKGFVSLFDESTNSVPTQHQDRRRKDLNGAGEASQLERTITLSSAIKHNYLFSSVFCVPGAHFFLQGLLNCPHGPLLAVQTLSYKLCNKVTLLCLVGDCASERLKQEAFKSHLYIWVSS